MATVKSTKSPYAEFKRLARHDSPGLQPVSTFSRTRIEFRCADLLMDYELAALSDEAFALFWRLMPFAPWGIPADPVQVGRMANWSARKVRRVWPQIEPFFERERDGEWRLADRQWAQPYLVAHPTERVPLRHLFRRLVDFWGRACAYCGTTVERLAIEHIIPKARGGADGLDNLTLACRQCNSRKGVKTAAEFGFPGVHDRAQRIQ
jgi:5-methylcytosine-specific restriction endonuclease McrA